MENNQIDDNSPYFSADNTSAIQSRAHYFAGFSASEEGRDIRVHSIEPTSTVKKRFLDILSVRWGEAVSVFVQVIKKQKELLDYNGHYIAFLMGQLSEQEFDEISEAYIHEPINGNVSDIENKIRVLLCSTGISFSSDDLSYFWNCSEEKIEQALQRLQEQEIITHDQI